jgi:hypothetical protein
MAITTYPLAWPEHFPRTTRREPSRFNTSVASSLANVQLSLSRFSRDSHKHIEKIVVSSNLRPGEDHPRDSGVAIWFEWDGLSVCIPIDRYHYVSSPPYYRSKAHRTAAWNARPGARQFQGFFAGSSHDAAMVESSRRDRTRQYRRDSHRMAAQGVGESSRPWRRS